MTDSTWIDALKELQECVQEERFDDAVSNCKMLLERQDELPPSLIPVLQETHLKCELHRGNYEQISKMTKSPSLQAYAYYRLHQYDKARNACQGDDLISQHVLAQSLYRLHDSQGALQRYQQLLQETQDQDERIQVMTNALAVATANATPYVADENPIGLDTELTTDGSGASYDLLYNLATYQLLTSSSSRKDPRALLQEAQAACLATLEEAGLSSAEVASEVASIHVQLDEWSLEWKGIPADNIKGENIPPAVSSVQTVNRAQSLKTLPSSCPTNWVALQQRLYYYKRAILQLRASLFTDCHDTCQMLMQSLSANNKKKKASAAPPPVPTNADEAWWKARVYVVEAHCLYQQSKTEEAVALLRERLDILKTTPVSSKIIDHAMAHVQIHLAHFQEENPSPEQTIQLLQELPESIQSRKAVIAMLVSLYQELGQTDQASAILEQSEGLADFFMSQGKYREAAELYESSGEGAKLVLALSYFDPVRAQQVWKELGFDEFDENDMDGEELEARELPRFKLNTAVVRVSEEDGKKKRSHEAVLRRRARKREEFLKKDGISTKKPDPERWLPKHERSYYAKRRRNRKGAQGGVSEKDAAKLDVAARAERGVDSSSGPSTAHMKVAGGNKRGGRRR
jgi:signal recognition particle subunit SRP72